MSELALLRDWTAERHPEITADNRRHVLRLFLESGKATVAEVGAQEVVVFFVLHVQEKGPARKAYTRSFEAFFDWRSGSPELDVPLSAITAVREYRDFMAATGMSPSTTGQYVDRILKLMAGSLVGSLEEIGEDQVVDLLKPFGPRSASRENAFHALRSFYTWATRRGRVAADPTAGLKVLAPREKDADAFSPEEIVALLDASHNPKHHGAILLAYSLGLRRSEVCGLTPSDIDWVNGRVRIRADIAKGSQSRFVETSDLAVEALEELRPFWSETSLVGGMDKEWFTMMVHQTAKRAGFPPGRRNAHLLRASFATHLLASGTPISTVSKLLGHAQIATTSRYLAVTETDRREAVATMKLPRSAAEAKGQLRWKAAGE